MTKQQIPKLVAALVEHQKHFGSLSTNDAQWVIQNPKSAVTVMISAVRNHLKEEKGVSEVSIFRAADTFFGKTKVKFSNSGVGEDFTRWFFKKVEDTSKGTLTSTILTRDTYNCTIIIKLGGKSAAESHLSEVWQLLERQPNGEDGELFTDSRSNIFYVKDDSDELRVLNIFWFNHGWNVRAYPLVDETFYAGCRVFYRKPKP